MLEKILRSGIKVAAVLLTAPATIEVAGQLYLDQPIYRVIVQLAALVLVEGALLLGWHMLDTEKQASTAQRSLYAALAIVAYVALWVIAVAHHEGAAGIVFRATLGVLLGYSVFESGILAGIKLSRSLDRDITKHRQVRKHRQRSEIRIAKLSVDSWAQLEEQRIRLDLEQRSREMSAAHSEESNPKRAEFPYPIEQVNTRRKLVKRQRIDLFREHVKGNPELPASQLVGWAVDRFGVAESTAWSDYAIIRPEMTISTNGNGKH